MNKILMIDSLIHKWLLTFAAIIVIGGLPGDLWGRTIYVSSSEGLTGNSGDNVLRPIADIRKAINEADTILLKAGDVFFEGGLQLSGKMLSRYGQGVNPTICGFKRILTPRWTNVGKNEWRLNIKEDNYAGIILSGSSTSNNICVFHDYERDQIHGRKVWKKEEMAMDWDFWQTETLSNAKGSEYDEVYLYLTEDPNRLKLEMSIYDQALRVSNGTVDGVNFVGFGFGISAGTRTTIRNCRIDAMGGRIIPEGKGYICYGNGIEFWIGGTNDKEDCLVENCYVSRCYDCGITIQGSGGTTATPRNIIIRNNLITNCCQGWEDFLRNNSDVKFENCVFENNIILRSGNTTGWGYAPSRFKYCHVLGNNFLGNKGMRIENNVFADGNFYCSGTYNNGYRSNHWKGNKCYLSPGDFVLGEYNGKRDVLRMNSTRRKSFSEITRYRELTGDETTVFYVQSQKKVSARADKLERKFLKRNRY